MPKLVHWIFPKRVWAFPASEKNVYLTFDDGPIPEITTWVLDELKKHQATATFFCIGDNIQQNPEIFKRIISEGHSVGNHTFNHLNGWKTESSIYIQNIISCEELIHYHTGKRKLLFRPPYGKITSKQAKNLLKKGYKIIMWNVLSYDYDTNISEEKCLQNILKNMKPGCIIVFHDSKKAEKNLRYVLPKVLEYAKNNGYEASKI